MMEELPILITYPFFVSCVQRFDGCGCLDTVVVVGLDTMFEVWNPSWNPSLGRRVKEGFIRWEELWVKGHKCPHMLST
ncbi:hypothetical protein Hanom_Chr02g00117511 [Helianthus anomalus]